MVEIGYKKIFPNILIKNTNLWSGKHRVGRLVFIYYNIIFNIILGNICHFRDKIT